MPDKVLNLGNLVESIDKFYYGFELGELSRDQAVAFTEGAIRYFLQHFLEVAKNACDCDHAEDIPDPGPHYCTCDKVYYALKEELCHD